MTELPLSNHGKSIMNLRRSVQSSGRTAVVGAILLALPLGCSFFSSTARGQLFDNLQAFSKRLKVGDPGLKAGTSLEGPKGVATADFNNDGRPDLAAANIDGSVTVYFGLADARFS